MTISGLRKWLDCADVVRMADGRVSLHPQLVWADVAALEHAGLGGDAEAALAHAAREQVAYRLAAVLLAPMRV